MNRNYGANHLLNGRSSSWPKKMCVNAVPAYLFPAQPGKMGNGLICAIFL